MGSTVLGTAEAHWRGHIGAWRTSGQSRRDYCAANGLSRKTFDWWVWRLDRAERGTGEPGAAPRFVPVGVAEVPEAIPVCAVTTAGEERIEIALPDGVLVRVGAGFEAAALHRVLQVLGR
jgi:hypothetical protein